MNKFQAMTALMRCVERLDKGYWSINLNGHMLSSIGCHEGVVGYYVFFNPNNANPIQYPSFMEALASVLDLFIRVTERLERIKEAKSFIENMRPRIEYFEKNPQADKYIITLSNPGTSVVHYGLTSDGVSDLSWCNLHAEKVPKTLYMFASKLDSIGTAQRAKDKHRNPELIQFILFSGALKRTSEYFEERIRQINNFLYD